MAKQHQSSAQVKLAQDTYLSLEDGKAVVWPDRQCGTRLGKKGDMVDADAAARAGLVNGAMPVKESPKSDDKESPKKQNKAVIFGEMEDKGESNGG